MKHDTEWAQVPAGAAAARSEGRSAAFPHHDEYTWKRPLPQSVT